MVSPLPNRIVLPLLAGSLLALYGWTTDERNLAGASPGMFVDSDGDFLPDALEWVMMTDPQDPDTDADGVGDFVEVAQNGFPLVEDPDPLVRDDDAPSARDLPLAGDDDAPSARDLPLARDHEMRVLATSSVDESGNSMLWAHLLFRSMGGLDVIEVEDFMPWVDVRGIKYPLRDLFRNAPLHVKVLEHETEGTLVLISVPVAWETHARRLLPFSFGVTARVDGREIVSSAFFMNNGGRMATLTALDQDRIGLQTLRKGEPEGSSEYSNRLCVLTLEVVGSSKQGKVVRVADAECEPAQGLRCGASCAAAVNSVFILPDGMSTITGG